MQFLDEGRRVGLCARVYRLVEQSWEWRRGVVLKKGWTLKVR